MRQSETLRRLLLALALILQVASTQDLRLPSLFDQAGREFKVPPDILKGIAFAETRWQHLEWADGDTASCMGLPRVYGVMALRDDPFFGHSLRRAAELIGADTRLLKHDVAQNIRGAAAYLRELYDRQPIPAGTADGSLESWQNALAAYCGIPQKDLATQHAVEILDRLSRGYSDFGIVIEPCLINIRLVHDNARRIWAEARQASQLAKPANQPDYPLARWAPAYPDHWYTSGVSRDFVVIHDMEGYYLSTISYFQQASTQASVHYDVNGRQDSPSDYPAGDITQQVEEQYWAWHARCLNTYSLGIEHEGFGSDPSWWTPEMYIASARLVRYMCDKYGIPKDRNHIIAHGEWQNSTWVAWAAAQGYPSTFATCNSHTDPGSNWDWSFYMQMIREDSTAPRVVSQPPTGRAQVYDKISITFDQRMERVSTEQNFHLDPAVTGTLSWSTDARTLTFTPMYLAFDAVYTVTVDTGAHNYLGVKLDANGDGSGGEVYSYTFRTVPPDTVPPTITQTYPRREQPDISTSVEFQIDFSEPLNPQTLAGAFILRDSTGSSVALTAPVSNVSGASMRARFHPVNTLRPDNPYVLEILQSLRDFGGNSIDLVAPLGFRTGPDHSFIGSVINTLDAVGSWWQPGTSGSTIGVKSASFSIAGDIRKSGAGSGKVTYEFSGISGGRVREYNGAKPTVDPGPLAAAWVYGDNSGNALEYWFYPGSTASYTGIRVGTLDWTGWKLVSTSIEAVPMTAVRQFAGFVIAQIPGARTSGTVYFDDLAVGTSVTEVTEAGTDIPAGFRLDQNFPNPFNPATTISYQLPSACVVNLRVYDALGRQVSILVSAHQAAGIYRVTWNAGDFPSGVYFCRLRAGSFVETRKMVLVR